MTRRKVVSQTGVVSAVVVIITAVLSHFGFGFF